MKSKSTIKELERAEIALRKIALRIDFGEDSFEYADYHKGLLRGLEMAARELAIRRTGSNKRLDWRIQDIGKQKNGWGPWRWVDSDLQAIGLHEHDWFIDHGKTLGVNDGVVEICHRKIDGHRIGDFRLKKISASALIDILREEKNMKSHKKTVACFRIKE
jgi:hypothetical protein